MRDPELDRERPNTVKVRQSDQLELWDSPFESDRQNLTFRDCDGRDFLKVFAISHNQLAVLYLEIGRALRTPHEPTIHHLKQIHETIGTLIGAENSDEQQESESMNSFTNE